MPHAIIVGHEQNIGQLDRLAFLYRKLFNVDYLARLDAMLLATCLDNCEGHPFVLCSSVRRTHARLRK